MSDEAKPGTVVHRPPPDTDCPVVPLKPQPWRVNAAATTRSIILDGQGRWILAAKFNDGFCIEVDATEAVKAAATYETETLRHELEIALRAVDREASAVAAKAARIQELEKENALVRDWLTQYYERYGDLGSGSGSEG